MKRKLVIFAVILFTLFNLSAFSALAYQRWISRKNLGPAQWGEPEMRMFRRLGLNNGQLSRVRKSRVLFFEKTEPLARRAHDLNIKVFRLLREDTPDTLAIFALIDSIGSIQNQLQKEAIIHIVNEGDIYTPEQRDRFFNLIEGRMGKHWEHRKCLGRMQHGPGWSPAEGMNREGIGCVLGRGYGQGNDITYPLGNEIDAQDADTKIPFRHKQRNTKKKVITGCYNYPQSTETIH